MVDRLQVLQARESRLDRDDVERRFSIDRTLLQDVSLLLEEDDILLSQLVRILLDSYRRRHPGIQSVIDQWRREHSPSEDVPRVSLSRSDLGKIYEKIGGSFTMEE